MTEGQQEAETPPRGGTHQFIKCRTDILMRPTGPLSWFPSVSSDSCFELLGCGLYQGQGLGQQRSLGRSRSGRSWLVFPTSQHLSLQREILDPCRGSRGQGTVPSLAPNHLATRQSGWAGCPVRDTLSCHGGEISRCGQVRPARPPTRPQGFPSSGLQPAARLWSRSPRATGLPITPKPWPGLPRRARLRRLLLLGGLGGRWQVMEGRSQEAQESPGFEGRLCCSADV